jgi:hypothetical protein
MVLERTAAVRSNAHCVRHDVHDQRRVEYSRTGEKQAIDMVAKNGIQINVNYADKPL